jgi:disulfide bond formation protein DsbB
MSKNIYLVVSVLCLSLIGFALFLQYVGWEGVLYQPCPLCILQRAMESFQGMPLKKQG